MDAKLGGQTIVSILVASWSVGPARLDQEAGRWSSLRQGGDQARRVAAAVARQLTATYGTTKAKESRAGAGDLPSPRSLMRYSKAERRQKGWDKR